MSNVIQHPSSGAVRSPLGYSLRMGEQSYRSLELLYAQNRLPTESVIIDSSKAHHQREFIKTLIDDEIEIILDTKCAELSATARYNGLARGAPWHAKDSIRPLSKEDFQPGSAGSVFAPITQYAIELGVHAIHSPSHFLQEGAIDPWFEIDITSLLHLRSRLDKEGRADIGIDFLLSMPTKMFQDELHQKRLLQRLAGLPFDNLVLRLSGFGADATAAKMKRTFVAIRKLHALGKPIVLDHVGGLVAQGALAFGVASGIAGGVGERARFDAASWHKHPKPREEGTSFGRTVYIPLPGLDRSFKRSEFDFMLASKKLSRRKLACHDRDCCGPQGIDYLKGDHRAHIAYQTAKSIDSLYRVPTPHRAGHFMNHEMRTAERRSRELDGIATGNESIDKRLADARKRIDSFSRTFETMIEEPRQNAAPQPVALRGRYLRRPA